MCLVLTLLAVQEGRTALQRAVEVESAACAETLMEAGADVSIQDKVRHFICLTM